MPNLEREEDVKLVKKIALQYREELKKMIRFKHGIKHSVQKMLLKGVKIRFFEHCDVSRQQNMWVMMLLSACDDPHDAAKSESTAAPEPRSKMTIRQRYGCRGLPLQDHRDRDR